MDVQHSQPKGWKAFQANFDFVFSQSNRLCTVCLTQQQIQALLSQTEYLYWPSRWVKAEGDVDPDIVTQFTEDLERQLLMACCDDQMPIQYRYSSTGELQKSLNGGGTWINAPENDVRVNSPQFPPLTGADSPDKRCLAATGAATLVKEQVGDQITGDMTRYTFQNFIHDWTHTVIDTSNVFTALVTVISNQIFALVLSALIAALTDDVYHKFACALDCSMANDASFNNAQWGAARSKILAEISGIAGIFLEHLVYLLGTQGLTNLVRSAPTAGDCSDCGCGNCTNLEDWHILTFDSIACGTIIDRGDNYITVQGVFHPDFGGVADLAILTTPNDMSCCKVTNFETLSGDGLDYHLFYVPCGLAQWPTGAWVSWPTGTTAPSGSQLFIRKDSGSNFQVKITFDEG